MGDSKRAVKSASAHLCVPLARPTWISSMRSSRVRDSAIQAKQLGHGRVDLVGHA